MAAFRRLPGPVRRGVVHTATPCYTVGAVVVLRGPDDTIALVEQRHSPGWALPGGLVKRGESPASGLIREVAEELGLTLDAHALPTPYAAVNARVRRVDVVFCIDAPPGVRLRSEDDVEVTGVGWFNLAALPEISEPTYDILRAVRLL